MALRVLPLADDWAERRMWVCVRGEPTADSALAALTTHLEQCANQHASG